MKKIISIIVPAYNEGGTITRVIEELLSLNIKGWKKQIIVVNDGSTDNTKTVVKKFFPKIIYHSHSSNLGKGQAIKSGLKYATGEVSIIQDADLEYLPADIPKLVNCYHKTKAVAVYGSRRLGEKRRGYFIYVLADKLANIFFSTFSGNNKITDIFTGYKLVKTSLLKKIDIKSKGFEVETEITHWLFKNGFSIKEVAISYNPRSFSKGKKLGLWKGFLLFYSAFRLR